MDRIHKLIKELLKISSFKQKKTVFLIGNTAKIIEAEFYITPIRDYNQVVVTGVIVYSERVAKEIAKKIDGMVDYVFVDAEKKIEDKNSLFGSSGNIERAVKEEIIKSIFISYKANDLTVDAADAFISEYFSDNISGIGGKKIAIIGAGNLGSKLALKLVERGANVYLYRRSKRPLQLIVNSINSIKSQYTDAMAYFTSASFEACKDADAIIGLTNGVAAINDEIINKFGSGSLLVDAGKGSFSKEAIVAARLKKIEISRLSIESILEGVIVSLISTHSVFKYKTGRNTVNGVDIISGGLLADKGEIVVDNCNNPKYIYGIGDGMGDFEREYSKKSHTNLDTLRRAIK